MVILELYIFIELRHLNHLGTMNQTAKGQQELYILVAIATQSGV